MPTFKVNNGNIIPIHYTTLPLTKEFFQFIKISGIPTDERAQMLLKLDSLLRLKNEERI